MFTEMRLVVRMLLEGKTPQEITGEVYEGNLFQYPTEKMLKNKTKVCLDRIRLIEQSAYLMQTLAFGIISEAKQVALLSMMLHQTLLAEFMVGIIGQKYREFDLTLARTDLNRFFLRLQEQNEGVASWTDKTIERIKGVLINILKENDYLTDLKSGILHPVYVSQEFEQALRENGLHAYLPAFNIFQ